MSDRIAELDKLLADQADGADLWLLVAMREAAARRLAELTPPPTLAEQIEDVLLSGLTGATLLVELWSRFPNCQRNDAFAAMAGAITILHADLMLAHLAGAVAVVDQREAA